MGAGEKLIAMQMSLREAWAKCTDTPLRFFVHLLFIIEGALAIVLIFGIVYKLDNFILLIIVIALIGLGALALILVFLLVAYFPKNLVFDRQSYLLEKALNYGDETHVIDYMQLLTAKPEEAPKSITDKTKEKDK